MSDPNNDFEVICGEGLMAYIRNAEIEKRYNTISQKDIYEAMMRIADPNYKSNKFEIEQLEIELEMVDDDLNSEELDKKERRKLKIITSKLQSQLDKLKR